VLGTTARRERCGSQSSAFPNSYASGRTTGCLWSRLKFARLGRHAEAATDFIAALKLGPDDPVVRGKLADSDKRVQPAMTRMYSPGSIIVRPPIRFARKGRGFGLQGHEFKSFRPDCFSNRERRQRLPCETLRQCSSRGGIPFDYADTCNDRQRSFALSNNSRK
jgi:hypothetical protein